MKITDDIYRIIKNRGDNIDRFKYVTSSEVVDTLNNAEKILIVDEKERYLHANFEI